MWHGNGSDTGESGTVVSSDNVYGDPKFTCTGDLPGCLQPYHILTDSLAVDAGVPVALNLPGTDLLVDIDLQLRPSGDGYDIGADEVVSETYSVWLVPPVSNLSAEPGQTVTHTHWLMNTGLQTDTYDLRSHSSTGWATLLAVSPITLPAQTSTTLQVRVSVSPAATNGMSDTTILTATSSQAQANALDVTAVITGKQTDLAVGKWADAEMVQSGGVVRFTLVVTNAGPLTDTMVVTLTDTAVPTQAVQDWQLPTGCTGDLATCLVTCTLTLPEGTPPVVEELTLLITTTDTYSGLLINTAQVQPYSSDVADPNASNNLARASVGVTPCLDLVEVDITGPPTGTVDIGVVFTATVNPPAAALPITFTWQATAQSPLSRTMYSLNNSVAFTWSITGSQMVSVTAVNECGVVVNDFYSITIETASAPHWYIYLPLVLRQFP